VLAPGAIIDPEDLRLPGEQPGTPVVVLDDLGDLPHGHLFRARQGKSLLLLTALVPDVTMQRELRDLFSYRVVQAGEVIHPNLLPTYGCAPLPLGEDGFDTLYVLRPDPGCPTLRQWLHEVWQAGHVLDPLNAVAIAVQVCEALAALHEKYAHGYVTADTVFMYPTGGMPQALLSATGEGSLLPFAPNFERFAAAGYLPQAGPELFQSPHEPRVETDVLGAAALVLEILTGAPLQPGMSLDRFQLPPRLQRVLEVASRPNPEDRPQDILMFSRRLQAAVGLGEDPVEPSAVLEPVHHADHADPRYPAMRARAWRPPPPPPPPWAGRATPATGSEAWNVGAPTPGSGAWNVGAPSPGSGAWNVGGAARPPGSGAWTLPTAATAPPSAWQPTGSAAALLPGPGPSAAPMARAPQAMRSPPAFGRAFPTAAEPDLSPSTTEAMTLPRYDAGPVPAPRSEGRTLLFGGAPPPPIPTPPLSTSTSQPYRSASASMPAGANLPPPPSLNKPSHSVSIMMPAPDGSVMAPLSRGPADFVIVRHGKRHGPYDLAQLERLVPLGKLRSVDAVERESTGEKILAVDLPGLRPLFEERARTEEASVMRTMPMPPTVIVHAQPEGARNRLWAVIGVLALGLAAAAVFLAIS
jgi:hypothetical protein